MTGKTVFGILLYNSYGKIASGSSYVSFPSVFGLLSCKVEAGSLQRRRLAQRKGAYARTRSEVEESQGFAAGPQPSAPTVDLV